MKGRQITIWGILISLTSLLGLEFWTLTNNYKEDTISEVINRQSKKWLFIPFLIGFLMGHWFWPMHVKK